MQEKPYAIVGSNQKGGTGKSTILMNIGACLAMSGRRTLLVELDRQGSVGGWLTIPEADGEKLATAARNAGKTVTPVLDDPSLVTEFAMHSRVEGFDVLCADAGLHRAPKSSIAGIIDAASGVWDYVLFDLRRDVEESIEDVEGLDLRAIVPVVGDGEQLTGVKKVMDDLGDSCEFRLVDNFIRFNSIADRVAKAVRGRDVPNVPVFKQDVRYSTKVREASIAGIPVVVYDPRNSASRDLRALTEEVIEWCEGEQR